MRVGRRRVEAREDGVEIAGFRRETEGLHVLDANFGLRGLRREDLHGFCDELVERHGARVFGAIHQVGGDVGRNQLENFDTSIAELRAERKRIGVEGGLGGAVRGRAYHGQECQPR